MQQNSASIKRCLFLQLRNICALTLVSILRVRQKQHRVFVSFSTSPATSFVMEQLTETWRQIFRYILNTPDCGNTDDVSAKPYLQLLAYLYLLEHVLQLNQKLLCLFSFIRDAVQSLGELALQRNTEGKHIIRPICVTLNALK